MNALAPQLVGDVSTIAELIFYLFLFVYVIFSAVLVYHWKSYATNAHSSALTLITYFVSTLLLLAVAALALLQM